MKSDKSEHDSSSESAYSGKMLLESLVLLCFEDSLRLYHSKSVIQGENRPIHKVKLTKPCCWTTVFKKDEKFCGLVLLYQSGEIEIRSLPAFDLVGESSLPSILRWNFKVNMDKTITSSDNGLIALVNGREVAFVSLLASENYFRIPESLPLLHDEGLFSKSLPLDPSQTSANTEENKELNIDDIEIDEPTSVVSTSSHIDVNNKSGEEGNERERLLQGGTDLKPRHRTPEEIIATYRKMGDASSAAAQARDKLVQRQEKLERINRRTEELKSGAEDFASLANELVKTMENRKWWNI